MLKRVVILVSIVAGLLALGFTYVFARFRDRDAIVRAQMNLEQLRGQHDSLKRFVAGVDSMQQLLQGTADSLRRETDSLRDQVDALEAARRANQLTVRRLNKPDSLKAKLRSTFPEMAASDWGITEVRNEEQDVEIQYLLVPLWFSETFIIDHQNALNFHEQNAKLSTMDTLSRQRDTLQNRVLVLEKEKSEAYRVGYDSAYTKYEALHEEYIKVLKNPRISLRLPGAAAILGSAAAGVVVGAVVAK